MIYLRLFWEFFKTGLFAFGGGMATIPFLSDISQRTGWFSAAQLADMIAVSESTPGPIGVNMATYSGFTTAGVFGAFCATAGLILPCYLSILIVSRVLSKFRENKYVDFAFYGLRAASAALIAAALIAIAGMAFFSGAQVSWKGIALAVFIFIFSALIKKTRKLHPLVFIAFSAVAGIVLGL